MRRIAIRVGGGAVLALALLSAVAVAPASAQCPPDTPPTASFTYEPGAPHARQPVEFNGMGSTWGTTWLPNPFDPGGGCTVLPAPIGSYAWNWGDGTPDGSGPTVNHTFDAPGTYDVALTVAASTGGDLETHPVTVVAAPPPDPPPPPPDTDAPETAVTKGAASKIRRTKATFEFISDEAGAAFACKLDKKAWAACTSPRKVKRLKPGKHKFRVRATDPAGNVDPTPAVDRFRVVET
jgi:hypothetical protein